MSATTAALEAATYHVLYTVGDHRLPTSDYIGAYSPEDAERRIRDRLRTYTVTFHEITQCGKAEPVTCTYRGPEGGDGAWQFLDHVDRYGPVLVCDVHDFPANPCVYDSDRDVDPWVRDRFSGPCQLFPDLAETPADRTTTPPVGTKASCARCAHTLWLRQVATTGSTSNPPNAPVFQWVARKGSRPRPIQCPVSDGWPTTYHRPDGYRTSYYGPSV